MIEAAKDMTDDEMKSGPEYFSSMKWTPWIQRRRGRRRAEDAALRQRIHALPEGGTEPIGNRIVESPESAERFELRDPRSGFIAYVPPGSLRRARRSWRAAVARRRHAASVTAPT
jgi:hypothetical protein